MQMRLSQPRLAPLRRDEWHQEDVRAALDIVQNGVGGPENPINIFTTLARHGKLLQRFLTFGNYMAFECSLDPRDRQMVILRTGFLSKAKYEWGHHVVISKRAGLNAEEIARIKNGPDDPGWTRREANLLRAVDELHVDQMLSDSVWNELQRSFDEKKLIEIIFLAGLYTLVSMALNSLGVQLDPGVEPDPDFPE